MERAEARHVEHPALDEELAEGAVLASANALVSFSDELTQARRLDQVLLLEQLTPEMLASGVHKSR
jgi:hypothetical protein